MTYRQRGGEHRDARPHQGRRQAVHCCRERSPQGSQPCCASTPGVWRDLDLTAACEIEAACRVTQRDCRFRSTVTERQLDHVPAMSVQPTDQCDQGSCPAFVQVSIQTRKGPLGFDRIKHIGDLKPPVDRNPSSARTKK